ncbi:MAG: transcription-repair coupling factor, partial [Victivallales bacterium]|nr:transcription-repair coupling factor [Victivallales bacterium]
ELAVHVSYGICRYHGVKLKDISGERLEALELEFAGDARIYVPLDQSFMVSRYVGGTKHEPALSRLGSGHWSSTLEKAQNAAWDLAAGLIRLEAVRNSSPGFKFHPAVDWERAFASSFPFALTKDQEEALEACYQDMAAEKPMDRLLCGDVGYGKTEVALRAAFRAVMNNKQVAVLVPTTVLAEQHFQTFRSRLAEFPVKVEVLSRFRTAAEQRKILNELAGGELDIVVGTHRLVSEDVHFANLGLVIIDEEQRFGVRHKQRLKELRASVDVLTMTATPIPRTLYLSLAGLRNLSTIMTAPANRLPVNTIVANYDETLIAEAIKRELERGGQVFFLHNRVQTIRKVEEFLRKLVPQARIAVGHGRMEADELEEVMTEFVKGSSDVLLCTTIIESGIDIPNANTIIIDHAERFGLSELYQLRGRVGRYFRQAYAYMLLPPMGILPRNARERMEAIKRFTHLGAGFRLAMKDMEIRGAGNLLGSEQSGHIAAVGFDLYCDLLKAAVARLQNQPAVTRQAVPIELEMVCNSLTPVKGQLQAVIPPEYVEEEAARVAIYKHLNTLITTEQVENYAKELSDRFGALPEAVRNLLAVQRLQALARQNRLVRVSLANGRVVIETSHGLYRRANLVPML